ncbi:uncharacterized protein LOC119289696 [Triticum dicoccoides]|uniref:uncharacterized protein LOC119289696 n=1 Tax=Triticum dicoccoides TaxID=85692 RepID=UPI001890148C|nr:uncharacterized protein LOC119289696 [Triticum dicoccoides]
MSCLSPLRLVPVMPILEVPGEEGERQKGSGITAADPLALAPSESSTPQSLTPRSSLPPSSRISKTRGGVDAGAHGAPISPVALLDRFAGEDFTDNCLPSDDCLAAFDELREGDADVVVADGVVQASSSPVRATRSSKRTAATKASDMMTKAMCIKAGKSLEALEGVDETAGPPRRGTSHRRLKAKCAELRRVG